MSRSWIFALAIAFMSAFAPGPAPAVAEEAAAAPAPRIEVTPMTVDFGNIDDLTKSKAVFTIKNTGNAELDIIDVRPTCGCTVANLSTRKIAPGGQASLEAVYDPHNASGMVHRFINVQCNDPKAQTVSLGITANVKPTPAPEIAFSIYNVQNIVLASGKSDTREVRITNTGQMDLKITEITNSAGLTSKMEDLSLPAGQTNKVDLTIKPGESKTISITVTPKVKSGFFSEVFVIRSNAKRMPAATFVEQGMVQG